MNRKSLFRITARTGLLIAVAGLLSAATGCAKRHHWYKHPRLISERDVVNYLQLALEGDLPDERREAINQIAASRYVDHDVVIDGLDTIARTDRSSSVRCAALLALRMTGAPRAVDTYVAILDAASVSSPVRKASPEVRRDALRGALCLLESGSCPPECHQQLRTVAIGLLAHDRSRDSRLLSARLLAHTPHHDVLKPLIDALDQRDFGIVYESERSLMRLTGMTFDHDSVAWRNWLSVTEDPFAQGGRLDPILDSPEKGWWRRSMESMRRTFASFRPKTEQS